MNSLLSLVDVYGTFREGTGGRKGEREGGWEGGNYFLLFCPMFSWHDQVRLLNLNPTYPQFRQNARICENKLVYIYIYI